MTNLNFLQMFQKAASSSTGSHSPQSSTVSLDDVDVSKHLCMVSRGTGGRVACSPGSPDCVDGYVNGENKFLYPVTSTLVPCTAQGLNDKRLISLDKAFSGDILENKTLYACVNRKENLIYSGLSTHVIDDAVGLPCAKNKSVLARITHG